MASLPDSIGDAPTLDEMRAAIDRITASEVFSRSPQLGAFLRYVAEAVLQGKANRIKAYTIGIEVLHRDATFDPQLDPIVRVEATRLRRAIERYYAGPGLDDPIVVDLPRGTYVPTFRRREIGGAVDLTQPPRFGLRASRPALVGFAAAVMLILIGGFLLRQGAPARHDRDTAMARDVTGSVSRSLPAGNGMPAVYIEPLRVVGELSEHGISPDVLLRKMNDAFARFDTINVVYAPPVTLAAAGGDAPADPRADYRLSGVLEYRNGHASAHFLLIDAAESNVVWSRSFDPVPLGSQGAEDEIVGALTESLLQSYGVIRSRDRAKHLVSNAGDPRYRCILEAADSFRTLRSSEHDRARACLENLTAADPSFAVGYTFLAVLYGREHQLGLARPQEAPPLDRALRAVRRSIELNPASARAYVVLMLVLFHRGELNEAFAAGETAIAMNKYDMLGLAEYGGRLILIGDVDKGMAMLRRAAQFGAVRPSWQHFYMFLGAYLGGDLKEAAYQAGQITAENYPSAHLARALLAVGAGDAERARQAVERLMALQPGWRDEPRRELAKLSPSAQVTSRLAGELAKAGIHGL